MIGLTLFSLELAPIEQSLPLLSRRHALQLNGAADPMVTAARIEAFRTEMDNADVDYLPVNYPDALHAFTNPDADVYAGKFGVPLKYDAAADADSWSQLSKLLREVHVQ
jgi:dienelactone hydrolase